MELVTGVIILPQRQTVLAAKQAAEVDLLPAGSSGWAWASAGTSVEYEALGQDFGTRGQRLRGADHAAAPGSWSPSSP